MRESGYIIIEGNIGVGKSTFAGAMAAAIRAMGARAECIYEPDEKNNPYLAKYYDDPRRYAFTMQMHLLHSRFAQTWRAQANALGGRGWYILDRSYYGDVCFARVQEKMGYFTDDERNTYIQAHRNMRAFLELPSAAIFLAAPPSVCKARIDRRGRECETGRKPISTDYIEALENELELLEDILDARCHTMHLDWSADVTPKIIESRACDIAHGLLTSAHYDWDF